VYVNGLALSCSLAGHSDDRRAARPLLHHPLRRRHGPQVPGDVATAFDFSLAGAPVDPVAVGESVTDQTKSPAEAVFDGKQEVGTARGEVEEKGRFACSPSAYISTPSRSTANSSRRRAWISSLALVA
jgi:hypothetical protein